MTNTASPAGGGGGSSRLWLNGVLVAIAGGGGGGGSHALTGAGGGQGGGFLVQGGSTRDATGGEVFRGGAPTLEAASAAIPAATGQYMRGGDGYMIAPDIPSTYGGGGGGGGYYGGGAGLGATISTAGYGGGGSTWYQTFPIWRPVTVPDGGGRTRTPVNSTDSDYPGNNIAWGGVANEDGYSGSVIVHALPHQPADVRVTQDAVEVLNSRGLQPLRITQQSVVSFGTRPSAEIRVTRQTVEIIRTAT